MATSPLHLDTQARLINETKTAAGSTTVDFIIESDSVLVTLYASSVGTSLGVSVYGITETETGQIRSVLLFSFPTVTGPTGSILLRRAAVSTERVRVTATYGTGGAVYEVYAKAIMGGGGASDVRILGSGSLRMSQKTITAVPSLLIAASLLDRAGVVFKNWSATPVVYVGATAAQAVPGIGWPLPFTDALAIDLDAGVELWASTDAGSADVRISESGAIEAVI